MKPFLFAFLSSLLFASATSAQVIEVPGDYDDLQAALDAAPADTTIVVHGGHWFRLTVTKPVRIVGDPAPFLWGDGDSFESPITLDGPGEGDVVLANVQVGMLVLASLLKNAPGIRGGGFDRLFVYDSLVTGPEWDFVYNWVFDGAPAIETTVPLVWIERSISYGSDTVGDDLNQHSPATNPAPLGAPGGSGVVTDGTVVLLDSTVSGGSGDAISHLGFGCAFECPGGDGGNGVECATLLSANSVIEAGEPTTWFDEAGSGPCCAGDAGLAVIAAKEVTLASDLTASGPLRLGQAFTLSWPASSGEGLLLGSRALVDPRATDAGVLFLDPATILALHVPRGLSTWTLQVPDEPALLGTPFAFQRLVGASALSRPVTGLVVP